MGDPSQQCGLWTVLLWVFVMSLCLFTCHHCMFPLHFKHAPRTIPLKEQRSTRTENVIRVIAQKCQCLFHVKWTEKNEKSLQLSKTVHLLLRETEAGQIVKTVTEKKVIRSRNHYLSVLKVGEADAHTHHLPHSLSWWFSRWPGDLLGVATPQRGFCPGGLGAGSQGQWYLEKKGGKSLK